MEDDGFRTRNLPSVPPGPREVFTIRRSQTWAGPNNAGRNSFFEEGEEGGPQDAIEGRNSEGTTPHGIKQSADPLADFDLELVLHRLDGTAGKHIAVGRTADFLVRSTLSREVVWRPATCLELRDLDNLACFEVAPGVAGGDPVLHWIAISEYPFRVSYPSGLRSGKKFYNGAKLFFATNPDDEEGGFDGAVSTALGSAHAAPPSKIKRSFATPRAMQMGAPIGSYIDTLGPLEKPRQLPPSFWPVPSEIQQAPSGEVVVQGKASRGEELLAAIAGGNDDGSRAVQHHYCHRRRTGASTSLRLHGEFINALRPGHVIGALDARTDTWVDALVIKLITDAPAIRWLNVEGTIGRGGSPSQPILIAVQITFLLDGACTTIPLAYDLLRPARSKGLPPPPAASSAIDCIVAVRMNDSIDKRDIALDLLVERIPVRIEGEVDGGVRVSLRNVKKAAAAGVVAVAADGDGSSGGSGGGGGNLVTLNPSTCVVEGWRLRSSSDSTSTAYFSIVDELADKVAFVNLICNQKWALIPAPSPPVVRPDAFFDKSFFAAIAALMFPCSCPSKEGVDLLCAALAKIMLEQHSEFTRILEAWAVAIVATEKTIMHEAMLTSRFVSAAAVSAGGRYSRSPAGAYTGAPTRPKLQSVDVEAIAAFIHKHGATPIPISVVPSFLKILLVRRLLGLKLDLFHPGATLMSGTACFSSSAPQIVDEMAREEEDFASAQKASQQFICTGCGKHAEPVRFAAITQITPVHWNLLVPKLPSAETDAFLKMEQTVAQSGLPLSPNVSPLAITTYEMETSDIVSRFAQSPRLHSVLYEIALDELRLALAQEIRASVVRAAVARQKAEEVLE